MTYKATTEGVTVEDGDVEVDLTVRGDEGKAEKVLIHARGEAVRAMRALRDGEHPDDVDDHLVTVAWDRVVGDNGGDSA
jgi:hypothetical protein